MKYQKKKGKNLQKKGFSVLAYFFQHSCFSSMYHKVENSFPLYIDMVSSKEIKISKYFICILASLCLKISVMWDSSEQNWECISMYL